MKPPYIGRIAPSPTGYLHLGHARTFWIAMERTKAFNGRLIYREEDIDTYRCKEEFSDSSLRDLNWFGCRWDEGPDIGGPNYPYRQSMRIKNYLASWEKLKKSDLIYPCIKSRKEIEKSSFKRNSYNEPLYPEYWRPPLDYGRKILKPDNFNWRFRVPHNLKIRFLDQRLGPCEFTTNNDFGDFLIWRKEGLPSYELAVVVDDIEMNISEVVRGEDLLISTARQLLLYRALGFNPPKFYHAPLILDTKGQKLSKSVGSISLRDLKKHGLTPQELRKSDEWWSDIENDF